MDLALARSSQRIDAALRELEDTDRIVVIAHYAGSDPVATIRDRVKIRDLVMFFEAHPDSWVTFSGVIPGYDFNLYQGDRLLGHLGLTASSNVRPGEDTLSCGDYFRRAPATEVAALAKRLDLPWPPP